MARVAIVTGGASEIGAAVALRLAQCGMGVALLDENACTDTAHRITELGMRSAAIGADVTDATSVDAALAEVCSTLGDPEVLVNVVGDALPEPDWYASTASRLRAVFLLSRAVVDPMIKNGGGRIITVAECSNATIWAGLSGFTRTIALELSPFGITSNVIDPAHVAGALPFLVGAEASTVTGQVVSV
ncbi:SDR family NAD(P)-dependent oxidoreductase [Lentzea tibetensis]|uniref:SDR family NAD(P)-dependent oxidoreductase n=1 Tax=Lentzea tibetensis TaxID=2591470 RepID=A0A563EHJ5_9PSEU|nr:SDR family NAD(P)-dependent oxidoreductase [Lentzea tibetensis]TWP45711.1 SDR family NAD(P)-dependent oxidoreductase [Lentzea tibetensis]